MTITQLQEYVRLLYVNALTVKAGDMQITTFDEVVCSTAEAYKKLCILGG